MDKDAKAKREAELRKYIADTDKETLWWAHYRLLQAVHAARYAADADKNKDQKAILHIIGCTADHWQPQLPGMPSYAEVAKEWRADDAHHKLTYLGERLGIYITGDEFMVVGEDLIAEQAAALKAAWERAMKLEKAILDQMAGQRRK